MNLHKSQRMQLILNGSITSLLYKLAVPNLISIIIISISQFSEAWYVGKIGTSPLASLAIVFPFVALASMFSAGAIGGGITSALSRAIGKNELDHANSVIWHSLLLQLFFSCVFFVVFVIFPRPIFEMIGGEKEVLEQSIFFSRIFFSFAPIIFLQFLMFSIFRGCGAYQVLAKINILFALSNILLSGTFVLGWGWFPSFGIFGVAISNIICSGLSLIFMFIYILRGKFEVSFKIFPFNKNVIFDILRVGGVSAINSLSIALTMALVTSFISNYGTAAIAGYGLCARLENFLIPFAFGIGGVLTSAVGTNFGASQYYRARKIAWSGSLVIFIATNIIGITLAIFPHLWLDIFTSDPEAYLIGALYLGIVGPVFGIFSGGKTLYFASQGTGNMVIPLTGGISRLIIVIIFGLLTNIFSWDIKIFFIGVALGLSAVGVILSINMFGKVWNPDRYKIKFL